DTTAPRLAVRLKGAGHNWQGIGAKVRVLGGPVAQSQEILCGGRYLSGDDPMRVFAAGAVTNDLTIDVRWRRGKQSLLTGARANRIFEIDEAGANEVQSAKFKVQSPKSSVVSSQLSVANDGERRTTDNGQPETRNPKPETPTLFEDVSHLLGHTHEDEPFDD